MRQKLMGFYSDTVPSSTPAPMAPHPALLSGAWQRTPTFFVGNQLPGNGGEVFLTGHTRAHTLLTARPAAYSANGVPGLWTRIKTALKKDSTSAPPGTLNFY